MHQTHWPSPSFVVVSWPGLLLPSSRVYGSFMETWLTPIFPRGLPDYAVSSHELALDYILPRSFHHWFYVPHYTETPPQAWSQGIFQHNSKQ